MIWQNSEEAAIVEREISSLSQAFQSKHNTSSNHASQKKKGTTSYLHQYLLVQKRSLLWHWRSPVYIQGKILLNVVAGLFIGFTFYQQDNSAQGLQNKLFATFTVVIQSARKFSSSLPRTHILGLIDCNSDNQWTPTSILHSESAV